MDLNRLITDFKKGDTKAYNTLYAMYAESVLGIIYNIVRDHDVAQELCQDVFIKVWNKANQYDDSKGRFFTWLINIARNTAIDHLRSRAFKEGKQNLSTDNFVDILGSGVSLEGQTDAIGIKKYVAHLKERCQHLIDALFFKGYTQQETSEALQIPLGTVKTQIRKCIGDLRSALGIEL
ncbi:MAG: sigma-70 family RNA polymerase sigma factor [Gilvibacter sp.]